MAPASRIDRLLQDPRIWQAGRGARSSCTTVPTGWPELDQALGGGWPLGQLSEILISAHGVGEFTLLLPALVALSGGVALISPPYIPYAPALERCGLNLTRLLVAYPQKNIDTLWAMEQALRSLACAAVVGWSEINDAVPLRRLQLAAEAGGSWAVLFRSSHFPPSRSPAPLRMHLAWEQIGNRLLLTILKRRGGPPVTVGVDIPNCS